MGQAAVQQRSLSGPSTLLAGGFVLSIITVIACATVASLAKVADLVLLFIVVASVWFVPAIAFGEWVSDSLLFLLAATVTLSIKKHFMPDPGHLAGAVGFKIAITDLLAFALMASVLLRRARSSRILVSVPRNILVAFGAYLAIISVSTLTGISMRLGAFQISAYVQAFALFVLVLNYLSNARRVRIFAAGLLLGLILQSSITVLQSRYPGKFRYAFLGSQEEEDLRVQRGNIVALPSVDLGTTTVGGAIEERPTGLLIHPNVLALYLVLSIPLAIGISFVSRGGLAKGASAGVTLLAAVALYDTLSRSGWVALVVALGIATCLWLRFKPQRLTTAQRIAIACLVLAGFGGVAWNAHKIYLRLTETADEAVYFRKNLSIAAARMIGDHPFLGTGLNAFTNLVSQYDSSHMSDVKAFPVHNIVLLETAESGLLGGAAFIAVWVCTASALWKALKVGQGAAEMRVIVVMTIAGLAGFFFGDMSNFVYRIPVMTSTVWAQAALGIAAGRLASGPSGSGRVE